MCYNKFKENPKSRFSETASYTKNIYKCVNKRKETTMINEKNNTKELLLKLCVSGMFAALVCVATIIIRVPTPYGGYWHFGDCFVLIAAWVLGPWYGGAAAGIGSMFADLFAGVAYYMPGTFVIKGAMAVLAAFTARAFLKKKDSLGLFGYIAGGIDAEALMIGGYFVYKWFLLGRGYAAAAASVPTNFLQGAFGLVAGVVIMQAISKTPVLKKFHAYAV